MTKRGLLIAALAALLASPGAAGAATTLMPGVSYERQKRLIGGGPVVLHILRAPRHGGLYKLRPVLSHGTVLGRQTVPQMQAAVAPQATTAGVNGDFFNFATGRPSGVFMRDGVLAARPMRQRAALGIAFDGRLLVDRFRFAGSWRGTSRPRRLEEINRPLVEPPGVALFTPIWGGRTPRGSGRLEVVLSGFPKALLNGYLTGRVVRVRQGGGHAVPAGGAVLQARGFWRGRLRAEAPVGTRVTVRLRAPGIPDDVADAIGGGPELVRDGVALTQTDEWFTFSQLRQRHPRTAVGQLADGRVLLVVADGRSSSSIGLTSAALARTMASLGAVTAMGLDGGGSTTLAFDGRVLNRPSDGSARAVADGLLVYYYGIYAPRVRGGPLTPNGDGVTDRRTLSAKVVRRSTVVLKAVRPNGRTAWHYRGVVGRGWLRRTVGWPKMSEGRWSWVVRATEVKSGRESTMTRTFVVNKTLGHLTLSKRRLRVPPGKPARLAISARLTRWADVSVRVRSSSGSFRRVLFDGPAGPGTRTWRWNGRAAGGRRVASGRYAVLVTARSSLGAVTLRKSLTVVRPRRS